MLVLHKISITPSRLILSQRLSAIRTFSSSDKSSQDPTSGKNEHKTDELKTPENESAADRLNRLLANMNTNDKAPILQKESLARPRERRKGKKFAGSEEGKENVIEAAKRVASLFGENVKETESELLRRLLNLNEMGQSASEKGEIDPSLPKTDVKEMSLSELIIGMKVDRVKESRPQSRGEFVRDALQNQTRFNDQFSNRKHRTDRVKDTPKNYTESVNLFGAKPMNIFTDPSILEESPDMLKTWKHLQQRELQIQVTHPPANYFQKMALWTKQGKVWKFPINNEQGMEEEAATDFTEHIFLEQHLEEWCPTKGPVRHFMELVCVGLSKNPYLTAKEKKEHLIWYQEYFENKKDILKDLMSQEKMDSATKSAESKQISSS